ncbi:P-loop containing nucleoside triphosphate hydrolase protein, partial [Lactarius quietus]
TGSGKTLPIALNVLLDDPDKHLITLTLSLLKHLQMTQESDFNSRYGIPTIVINEDTPREDSWWTDNIWNHKARTPGRARLLIVTVEQLFKSREGHLPHLAILLWNQFFQRHVERIVVDEAHNIYTSRMSLYGLDAFRLVWGLLDELRALLPRRVQWAPNTTYATHQVVNNIDDMRNYECFLSSPFSLESQSRILIFVDKKELACHISAHLDSLFRSNSSSRLLCSHVQPLHNCRILVATSGQSVGIDFLDAKIVCTAGLPGTMVDVLQHGGRALRNSQDDALFIILYESWVHEVSLDEYTEGNLTNPDRPRAKLKSSSQQRECAPLSCLRLVKSPTCL